MENPRKNRDPESLLAELNNAHAREAATREILDLVVQYRDDQIPVFNAILKNATRLCHAPMALLGLLNNEKTHIEIASHIGARTDYFNFLKENPPEFAPNRFLAAKAMQNLEVLHIEDITHQTIVGSEMPHRDQAVSKEGMRTVLFAPMQFKDAALGCIILYRREVRPFSVAEIDLVQTFASKAVIAVENIRQFHEVQIRLHRETATKNILSVMSKSRDDEVPVFDAILTNATRLCNAPMAGLVLVDTGRKKYRLVASRGAKPEFVEALKKSPPDLDPERFAAARAIIEKRVVHVEDLASPTLYGADEDHRKTTIDTEGIRTTLFVPLIWNNQSIGAINE